MSHNSPTKQDIVEKIEYLEGRLNVGLEYGSTAQGWWLIRADTFDRIGPVCQTKAEFMTFLRGIDYGSSGYLPLTPEAMENYAHDRDDVEVTAY